MTEPKTPKPTDPPKTPAEDPQNDRTVFTPSQPQAGDADRTVFQPTPEAQSQPPASQPPSAETHVSQPPASQPPGSQPPISQAPVSEPTAPPVSVPPQNEDATVFTAAPGANPIPGAPPNTPPSTPPVAPEAPPSDDGPDPDATQFVASPEVPPVVPPVAPQAATSALGASPAAAAPPPATQAPAPQQPPARGPVAVGTLINNNYEIKEVLKAGGMGEVYRGENVHTRQPVAIKVILPELAEDEKVGLMFLREATTLSELSDEAIVGYQNFIKDPVTGRYCLIMDFISGVPLSDFTAKNGAITKEAGRTLLKRLAKGLEKAHARDVIHRDLSPDNVMLPDGIIAEALLIDFGIAKSNVVKEGTMAGQFAGKFKYVSPEQLGHFGGDIGPATDIYGLALLMAAALRGKPLDMGGSIVEAVEARRAIPDLSDMPETLAPLLAHMLEPDPKDRPTDMAKVAHLLEHPEEIPPQYNGGVAMAALPSTTTTRGTLGQPAFTVSGLQTPPTATPGTTTHTTMNPTTMGQTSLPPTQMSQEKSGGGKLGLLALVLLAGIGAGGYFGWQNGVFDGVLTEADATGAGADGANATPDLPAIQPNSREGFLAAFDTGSCTFASRISGGRNAGMVQGFGQTPGTFAGLPTAYEEKFGARPAVLERLVTADQCAALDFARSLQGRGIEPIQVRLDHDEVPSGAAISGQVVDPLGRQIWLVLVTPNGGVFNLTSRLSDAGARADQRNLRFGLSLAQGAEAAPQLLLAVATGNPLASAATARDGEVAQVLLDTIKAEITASGGKGVAALGHILLTPAQPDTPQEEGAATPETGAEDAQPEGETPAAEN